MAKMGVTREKVVVLAAEIADAKGLDALSLKEIAEKLNIRPPAMFNHVSSLQDLKEELSVYGSEMLKDKLIKAAFGKAGIDALREMARAYYAFAKSRPGVYAAIKWMNIWKDEKNKDFILIVCLVTQIAADFGYSELEGSHLIRLFRSYLHGFADIVSHDGFGHNSSIGESFEYGLEIILSGLKNNKSL